MSQSIPLRHGQFTLVDDEDHAWLSQHRWRLNSRGYVVRSFQFEGRKVTIGMHREIIRPEYREQVDHVDRDRLNNTRANLRSVTRQENLQHRGRFRNNSTGYKGVTGQHGKWHARIQLDGKLIHLGFYEQIVDAAQAYDYAAQILFGEYALLNLPEESPSMEVEIDVGRILQKHVPDRCC